MVERAAVNRDVAGSSPASGANLKNRLFSGGFLQKGGSVSERLPADLPAKIGFTR
jgi:hypothetical protein